MGASSAPGDVTDPPPVELEVGFVGLDGRQVRMGLAEGVPVRFEAVPPVAAALTRAISAPASRSRAAFSAACRAPRTSATCRHPSGLYRHPSSDTGAQSGPYLSVPLVLLTAPEGAVALATRRPARRRRGGPLSAGNVDVPVP